MAHEILVVDLSHWNTIYSFEQVKAAGVVGVIHKATEGASYVDPDYAQRRIDAEAAGLKWSSYHFMRPGNQRQHVDHYLMTVLPENGARVCLDFEDEALTLDDLYAAVDAIVEHGNDLQIGIYSGALIKRLIGNGHDAKLAPHALWLAHYTSAAKPEWPKNTWPHWSLWQYSDGEQGGEPRQVAGIATPHDCNAFNGTRDNCAKWFGPAVAPEVVPTVYVSIDAPTNVRVIVSVNGEPV